MMDILDDLEALAKKEPVVQINHNIVLELIADLHKYRAALEAISKRRTPLESDELLMSTRGEGDFASGHNIGAERASELFADIADKALGKDES